MTTSSELDRYALCLCGHGIDDHAVLSEGFDCPCEECSCHFFEPLVDVYNRLHMCRRMIDMITDPHIIAGYKSEIEDLKEELEWAKRRRLFYLRSIHHGIH